MRFLTRYWLHLLQLALVVGVSWAIWSDEWDRTGGHPDQDAFGGSLVSGFIVALLVTTIILAVQRKVRTGRFLLPKEWAKRQLWQRTADLPPDTWVNRLGRWLFFWGAAAVYLLAPGLLWLGAPNEVTGWAFITGSSVGVIGFYIIRSATDINAWLARRRQRLALLHAGDLPAQAFDRAIEEQPGKTLLFRKGLGPYQLPEEDR